MPSVSQGCLSVCKLLQPRRTPEVVGGVGGVGPRWCDVRRRKSASPQANTTQGYSRSKAQGGGGKTFNNKKKLGKTDTPRGTKRPTQADQLEATSCFMILACFAEPMAKGRASHLCQLANCRRRRRRLNQSLVTRCRITPHVEG